jgi:catalase
MHLLRTALGSCLLLLVALPVAADDVTGKQLVDGLEGAFGKHPQQRRAHPKGVCVSGDFTPTPAAKSLSKSLLFEGGIVPVVGRFSLAGGDPDVADGARIPRGLALRFTLKDKSFHQMATITAPVFGAATPQTFLGLLQALKMDPATGTRDPARIEAFIKSHPDTQPQAKWLAEHNPAPSFITATYFGVHAFKFTDAAGASRFVRFRFVPVGGDVPMTDAELKAAPHDFLRTDLQTRLAKRPATWQLLVTRAEPGDPTDDPTREWPASRKELNAGTLRLTAAESAAPGSCDPINFDPTVLSAGVEPSNDPILLIRSEAYAASSARRRNERKSGEKPAPAPAPKK